MYGEPGRELGVKEDFMLLRGEVALNGALTFEGEGEPGELCSFDIAELGRARRRASAIATGEREQAEQRREESWTQHTQSILNHSVLEDVVSGWCKRRFDPRTAPNNVSIKPKGSRREKEKRYRRKWNTRENSS